MRHGLIDFLLSLPLVVSLAVFIAATIWYWVTHPDRAQKKALALRGKVKFSMTWQEMKYDRE